MEISVFTMVLLVCVVVLLIYIAYIKGRTSSGGSASSGTASGIVSGGASGERYVNLQAAEITHQTKAVVRKDPANVKHLTALREQLGNHYSNIAANVPSAIFIPFLKLHDELCDFYSEVGSGDDNHIDIARFERVVNWGPLNNARTGIEAAVIDVTDYVSGISYGFAWHLHETYPDANMKAFLKDDLQYESWKQRVQSVIRKQLPQFYAEFNELVNLQSRCLSFWRNAKPVLEESPQELLEFVKGFKVGAIIAINPFIGIPTLIESWCGEKEKEKRKEQTVNDFFSAFQLYLSKWDEVKNLISQRLADPMAQDMNRLMNNDAYKMVIRAFEAADNAGYSIKGTADEILNHLKED